MNDEQMQPLLEAWLRDREIPRPKVQAGVVSVMANVPQTRQQRGRRWPFGRVAPAPIPPTNGPTPARGFTMLSALKFIAASVIVALFGGFLLAGILTTQQSDEVLPAAVTVSPSPMTSEELLSGMVAEEVEPGVLRVIDDGYRDLTNEVHAGPGYSVDVTPDGSVWLRSDRQGLYRLGDEATFDDPTEMRPSIEVAPDGSLWAIGQFLDDRMSIFSFDGQGWTERATKTDYTFGFDELAIGPDGTVWVTTTDESKYCPDIEGGECPGTFLMRLEDDGSLTTIDDWADVYDGDAHPYSLVVSPVGDAWLRGERRSVGPEAEALLRFDGSGWEALSYPEGFVDPSTFLPFGFGPDGTLWVQVRGLVAGDSDARGLARFDDPGWTMFTEPDDGLSWQGLTGYTGEPVWPGADLLTVAADGSLWHPGRPTEEDPCGGVAHFDGATWTTYLVEACISDLAIAPDGSVWLLGDALYVITPEAVAVAEAIGVVGQEDTVSRSAGCDKPLVEPGDHEGVNDVLRAASAA